MRAFLASLPPGKYFAEDFLDNDGVTDNPVKISVTVSLNGPCSNRRLQRL